MLVYKHIVSHDVSIFIKNEDPNTLVNEFKFNISNEFKFINSTFYRLVNIYIYHLVDKYSMLAWTKQILTYEKYLSTLRIDNTGNIYDSTPLLRVERDLQDFEVYDKWLSLQKVLPFNERQKKFNDVNFIFI